MDKGKSIDKTMVTRAVIIKIQDDRDPELIKATHLEGYADPDPIYIKGEDKAYKPDIVSVQKDVINVYEIELNDKMPVEKWRLFSAYAHKHNGNLFLVVPDYLKESIKNEIKDKKIPSGLIYFDTE
jgi:hypothetical protein